MKLAEAPSSNYIWNYQSFKILYMYIFIFQGSNSSYAPSARRVVPQRVSSKDMPNFMEVGHQSSLEACLTAWQLSEFPVLTYTGPDYIYWILHKWSSHMKFMKRAFGEFHEFHTKWPQVYDSVSHMTLQMRFIAFRMNIISIGKHIVDTDIAIDVTYTRQSVITCVVIWFLWHDVIHWITLTPCD